MNRRQFLTTATALTATGFAAQLMATPLPKSGKLPQGPVTLYYEFRVAPPENEAVLKAIQAQGDALQQKPGFLSLSCKQMTGDSTMVKNYPAAYKGVLAEAYLDGVTNHTQPYFYALYLRFENYQDLLKSEAEAWFDRTIIPHLHGYQMTAQGMVKAPQATAHYRGIFQTIAAGNRSGIMTQPKDIIAFLKQPVEVNDNSLVSVANHVMIADAGHEGLEGQVVALLTVAQQTYQPMNDPAGMGLAGAKDNSYYRKAVSTEILRNAFADGDLRAYLFHGVWQSVWDHENSHLDARFQAAVGPVGGAVIIGPVEPFYQARITTINHA
jgi:hypothetical protein